MHLRLFYIFCTSILSACNATAAANPPMEVEKRELTLEDVMQHKQQTGSEQDRLKSNPTVDTVKMLSACDTAKQLEQSKKRHAEQQGGKYHSSEALTNKYCSKQRSTND